MPLYLTGSHSSRVTKPRRPATLQKSQSLSLPFGSSKRTRTLQRAQTLADKLGNEHDEEDEEDHNLAGPGRVLAVVERTQVRDVLSAIRHTRSTMFDPLPERAGMNSVRIAEVLNFQKNLPAVVSLAHVHALRSASSKTERDIQALLSDDQVRRIKLVGRGNDISGLSEFLITTEEYGAAARKTGLPNEVVSAFLEALQANPRVYALPPSSLSRSHVDALIRHGFLVSPSIQGSRGTPVRNGTNIVAPATISRSASGSQAAVGGEAAFETLGGVNGARRSSTAPGTEHVLSIPGIAAYLKLLDAARNHFVDLLRQFSKHRQAPAYLLKERWNGNVDNNENQVSVAKRVRGEFSNVLAAKTKKWKALNGLSYDWIMEECLGAGLIELFQTYSVGLGVRALT
ncbi:hypothetical protein PMZ80_004442 [Knufia obscura]|uniref:Serine-threonine protein kinase 19-domain-containing protein n=2 Tax=Knufia TaxID=430999 RepID=A0AAN8I6J1_9EURO|nr:hypothetical protein PMZ80_004442 [Knufia obscura]KAK5951680.1 hypothetical protein OHC33_007359 [Knufia fluminis]